MKLSEILQEEVLYLEKNITRLKKVIKEKYSFGIIAMTRALAKGDEVGVLTARGNQMGHAPMIRTIKQVAGKTVIEKHQYFVNDEIWGERLSEIFGSGNSHLKKFHVLVEYRNGVEIFKDMAMPRKHKQYQQVKFYDDEAKNLMFWNEDGSVKASMIAEYKEIIDAHMTEDDDQEMLDNLVFDGIKGYNIKSFDNLQLKNLPVVKSFLRRILRGFGGAETIHFFDLDGTVFMHPVKMFVHENGKYRFAITQEEFAEHKSLSNASSILSEKEMEERAKFSKSELNDMIEKGSKFEAPYTIDFSSFRDDDKIAPQAKVEFTKQNPDFEKAAKEEPTI